MKKAQVYAKHNRARISPKKMAIVMDLVRGAKLFDAKRTLAFDPTKAAKMLLKVVKSAEANANNNLGLKSDDLRITDLHVSGGRTQKWGRPGSKGRFNPILKRSSHIVVGLSADNAVGKGKK